MILNRSQTLIVIRRNTERMVELFPIILFLLIIFLISGNLMAQSENLAAATAQLQVPSDPGNRTQKRIESAEQILTETDAWRNRTKIFHKNSELLIAESKRLKGEAETLEMKTLNLPKMPPLTGDQLKVALGIYQNDINLLRGHAESYDQHLRNFQSLIGECQSSNHALNSILRKYDLHIDQFHIPVSTIRPPHICGSLEHVLGNTSSIANQIMYDQMRVLKAEANLRTTEEKLSTAQQSTPLLQGKAIKESLREKEEQQLLAEYARLKEEYDLLSMEKARIDGSKAANNKITNASVAAELKK
jgi:hypothetical protein